MADLEIGEKHYRTGRIDGRKQFHVVRILSPMMTALGAAFSEGVGTDSQMIERAQPMFEALAAMSQADADMVINTCLAVCEFEQAENKWFPVYRNGNIMFDTVDGADITMITFRTLQENLSGFFPVVASLVGAALGAARS